MRRCLLGVCILTALAVPGAALARVGVRSAAKVSLVHAALGGQAPRQCATTYISSVDHSWAAVFVKPAKGWGVRCKAFRKGWVALRHTHGSWRVQQKGAQDACVAVHVPVAIRRDLQIPCFALLP
jgi:hypothetical protein